VNPYPWFYSGEPSKEIKERWQWTFPIIFSKVDPKLLFVSSQRLWATRGRRQDLVAPVGRPHAPRPRNAGEVRWPDHRRHERPRGVRRDLLRGPQQADVNVIWTGSDDGLVHVTRDFGKTWTNVTPKEMPDFGRVSPDRRLELLVRHRVHLGAEAAAQRLLALHLQDDRLRQDVDEDRQRHPRRRLRACGARGPHAKGLLYAATQHGVYLSYDDGANWQNLSLNLPDVPVADLIVEGTSS
jgi:hypothetical protein